MPNSIDVILLILFINGLDNFYNLLLLQDFIFYIFR
jgi:hypothetical protein